MARKSRRTRCPTSPTRSSWSRPYASCGSRLSCLSAFSPVPTSYISSRTWWTQSTLSPSYRTSSLWPQLSRRRRTPRWTCPRRRRTRRTKAPTRPCRWPYSGSSDSWGFSGYSNCPDIPRGCRFSGVLWKPPCENWDCSFFSYLSVRRFSRSANQRCVVAHILLLLLL